MKTDINVIVQNEIIEQTIDLSTDYSEIALDIFLNEGVLKEIPIVKSIVSFYNITNSIVERNNVKKILTFFQTFHQGDIDSEKLEKFKLKFNDDINYQNKVIETILLLNERFLDSQKSKILANLMIAHINGKIDWKEFLHISIILENIHPKAFDFLSIISKETNWANQNAFDVDEVFLIASGIGYRTGSRFYISDLGQKLYNFGIEPIKK